MAVIHGVILSPFVRKVRVVMEEKGLDYEINPVLPFQLGDDFLELHPLKKIPVYEEAGYILPDSSCIALYLERKQPEPPLYPTETRDYGTALFLEEYADTHVVAVLSTPFIQRVVNQRMMKLESKEDLVQEVLTERIPPVFDWLEERTPEAGYIVGGEFSIADLSVVAPFVNLHHADERVDAARWPRLAAYVDRVLARPSFSKLVDEEDALLKAAG